MSYKFLFKLKNSSDRDKVAYVEIPIVRFECGHYFSRINLHGPCYSCGFKMFGDDYIQYENIVTILTKDEYQLLIDADQAINDLGYGIKMGDDRYQKGVELLNKLKAIEYKLFSEENEALFLEIQEEEKEELCDTYNLSEEEVDEIWDNYYLDYRDSSVVGCVYKDSEDLGWEEAHGLGYMKDDDFISTRYFDYERFGEDLVDNQDQYYELSDGRIVSLCY